MQESCPDYSVKQKLRVTEKLNASTLCCPRIKIPAEKCLFMLLSGEWCVNLRAIIGHKFIVLKVPI